MRTPNSSAATLCSLLLALGFVSSPTTSTIAKEQDSATKPAVDAPAAAPRIQLAILLDTSGSMQGLINQARTQLWKIVNDLALTKQNGKTPSLQVALYEYGKSSLPASEGYLQQIVPLSDNLDLISEKLFELTTNGGSEYCGWVIGDAVDNLEWSQSNNDLKMIFIAGNEPFTQGPVDYRVACKKAIERGITVNCIHCGDESTGRQGKWADGAALADGSFMNINHNDVQAEIATPYDKKLIELGGSLNQTYVTFGDQDKQQAFRARQSAQDSNAEKAAPSVGASRAATKGSSFYKNSNVDLIDARREGKVDLKKLSKKELPEELQKLSPEELGEHLDKKEAERKKIQVEIQSLNKQRSEYLAKERAKEADSSAPVLEDAVGAAIRKQAAEKNFKYEKP